MHSVHLPRPDGLTTNVTEFQTTTGILSCALDVIHLHKEFLDIREHRNEIDRFIARSYLKKVIEVLIAKATQWLSSPITNRQEWGSRLVELLSETDVDRHPEYQAYRQLLHTVIGNAPVMRLHLQALELVAAESRQLRKTWRKATVTESVLAYVSAEMNSYSGSVLQQSQLAPAS